ncbi:hypothetical protein RHSIM_Rhsim13G0164400 [Rhododendron simsii]|uniref:Uncharacterized protein n=1 Tax=Rhododendron simsii TaxID=118357 RepID=A0A834G0F6_RHOSS|nr:hypothetical protein RHSIM_Rhsim13G0164400 [Rhododendron simsii]
MSPEYVIDGLFSVKSNIFSFGVLVLKIVSGKKNRGFYHPDSLPQPFGTCMETMERRKTLEWKLWYEGKPYMTAAEATDCGQIALPGG